MHELRRKHDAAITVGISS